MKRDPLAAPPPAPLAPVDLADPIARDLWLHNVRANLAELTSAAREATGPKKHRILSRAEFRRAIDESGAVLFALLAAATDDADEPAEDEPGYGGDCTFTFTVGRLPGHTGPDLFEQIDRGHR